MGKMFNYPMFIFLFTAVVLWIAARVGQWMRRKHRTMEEDEREDFGLVVGATLTLLGLIIGFSFSMAVSRYDQRKNYEEAEANAIGTEYVRADLLPTEDAAKVRMLLKSYLEERILFYTVRDREKLKEVNAATARIQGELWNAVRGPAAAQPTAVSAVAIIGMNDVLNSQGYTQAAWWNRIPTGAWILMIVIAVSCNLLVGYGAQRPEKEKALLLVIPLLVATSFFLIADIDSPRGGLIKVKPQNLVSLAESLR